ncbi:MAG: cohesin domain-containing protein [Halanaerobiales bacterium]
MKEIMEYNKLNKNNVRSRKSLPFNDYDDSATINSMALMLEDITVNRGEIFKIPIKLSSLSLKGINLYEFKISFDRDILVAQHVHSGDLVDLDNDLFIIVIKDNHIRIAIESNNIIKENAVLAEVEFKVRESALPGNTEILLENKPFFNVIEDDVEVVRIEPVNPGIITIN